MKGVQAMVDDVLRPLIRADGGDVELVSAENGKVVLRVSGTAAYGAGSEIVRRQVLEAGVKKVAKDAVVVFEKVVPKARRRSDPGDPPPGD